MAPTSTSSPTGVLGDGAEHGADSRREQPLRGALRRSDESVVGAEVHRGALDGDDPSWGHKSESLKEMTSRVSPNGRYLAFMSERSLTGYENRDANSGVPDEEVFLYDASTGRLVCASCNPTGARPVGIDGSETIEERLWSTTAELWGGRWLAANIPGWTTKDLAARSTSRAISQTAAGCSSTAPTRSCRRT